MDDIIEKELTLLYWELYFAKHQYYIFDRLYKDLLNTDTNDNLYYVKISTFDALEYSILLKLTKVYDKDNQSVTLYNILSKIQSNPAINKKDKTITEFCENKLETLSQNNSISTLKYYRDKNISHLDKHHLDGLKNMGKENIFKYEEIIKLIDFTFDTINELFHLFNINISDNKCFELLSLELDSLDKIIPNN